MRIRRCVHLLIEPREQIEFSLESLADGGDGIAARIELFALAAHLDAEVAVDADEVAILNSITTATWREFDALASEHAATRLRGLLEKGLLISDAPEFEPARARDETLRAANWQSHSAVAHYFGRWRGVTSGDDSDNSGVTTMRDLFARLGAPPPHVLERVPRAQRLDLPSPRHTSIDAILARRATCRNFDAGKPVDNATFADIMHRVFGAQAAYEIHADNVVIKRNSPSGGGLHPTEAYVVVQNVDGIAPGLYHYHPIDHALEPLPPLAGGDLSAFIRMMVAAQKYFADAAVFVVMAARFARTFWKYRNHSKAYRAIILDVGHLSQNLYLSATEFDLGAFITAAINEVEIEQAFGLDPLIESPLAVVGFGHRGPECVTFEFDPNRAVWPEGVSQPR